MIIIGRLVLDECKRRHVQSIRLLDAWERKLRRSNYRGFLELRKAFPKADYVYHKYTIFDIGGNKYRPISVVDYSEQVVLVKQVLTHAEYDRRMNRDLMRELRL